jgi:hypothetical protein
MGEAVQRASSMALPQLRFSLFRAGARFCASIESDRSARSAQEQEHPMLNLLKTALIAATLLTLSASHSFAEPKHGIAMHGEPALPADFKNFPYVNPDAPKGGAISYGVIGTFDNLNPFILKSMRTTALGGRAIFAVSAPGGKRRYGRRAHLGRVSDQPKRQMVGRRACHAR